MILLRHGESHFNAAYGATRRDPGLVDPGLTEAGIRQVELAAELLAGEALGRIVASPYARTLETAEIVAARLDLRIEIEPLVRERAYFTCDIGSSPVELRSRWPHLDFGALAERWWTDPEESEAAMQRRCADFHAAAAALDDWHQVLVVSHWAFIKGLTGSALGNAETIRFTPSQGPSDR